MRKSLVAAVTMVAGTAAAIIVATQAFAPLAAAADDNYVSFLSPSRNISCELNYRRSGIPDETYCQTDSPPASVRMDADGVISTCRGETCLGNAGTGTPTLAYGQMLETGPFTCRSEARGVTCTVVSGRGFTISSAGIAPVG